MPNLPPLPQRATSIFVSRLRAVALGTCQLKLGTSRPSRRGRTRPTLVRRTENEVRGRSIREPQAWLAGTSSATLEPPTAPAMRHKKANPAGPAVIFRSLAAYWYSKKIGTPEDTGHWKIDRLAKLHLI